MTGWGPYFWATFHIASLTAGPLVDETDKATFIMFVEGFARVLPCPKCREHFADVLIANPIDYKNIFEWSVKVHNEVNLRLGKPIVTVEDALTHWSTEVNPKNSQSLFLSVFAILIVVALIFFLMRK